MVVLIVRLLFILAGGIGGYEVGQLAKRLYLHNLDPIYTVIGFILSFIVFLGLGYVAGGVTGRFFARMLHRFQKRIEDVPGVDLFMGAVGIITGFLIAFFPSMVLFRSYPGWIFGVALYVIFGSIGYVVAVQKRDELVALFRPSYASSREREVAKVPPGGSAQKLVDTSALIDGRIVELCRTGFLEGVLVIPRFVLHELQRVADSEDPLKRNRGRRGLDVVARLKELGQPEVRIEDMEIEEHATVDATLISLARLMDIPLLTTDYNLKKVAELQGVRVLNVNELAEAVRPVVLPGEVLKVSIVREGKEPGQGVGYMEDGTMVVVEGGKELIGQEVEALVTSVLQTSAGRMIFCSLKPGRTPAR